MVDPSNEIWHEEALFIDGTLRPAKDAQTYPNIGPASGAQIGVAADASGEDLDEAIAAARAAFDTTDWSTNTELRVRCLRQLGDALRSHVDQITALTVAEVGATAMACGSVQVVEPIKFLDYYADMAESYGWTQQLGVADTLGGPADRWIEREPIGVVGAITPWNVPHQINLAKVAPALAAGCTVVLKPAPETPWSGLMLGRLIADHTDFPPGVINIVTSSEKTIGAQLVADPRVDMISFTGSTQTGRTVMETASANITKVFLELGGKSVHLVLDDVEDMMSMAFPAAFGIATVAGQGCALTTRVLLPRSRYQEGLDAIESMMATVPAGDPSDPATMMGPLISEAQLERVENYVAAGIAAGARVVCGAKRAEGLGGGWYYEPTLLADVTNDMVVAQEEIFGPVLVAIAYEDDDDAVSIANGSIYGLSGSVFSADEQRAIDVARRIRTGTMSINGGIWYGCDVPFGGYKQSGLGRESGTQGFEEYLETKSYARPAPS